MVMGTYSIVKNVSSDLHVTSVHDHFEGCSNLDCLDRLHTCWYWLMSNITGEVYNFRFRVDFTCNRTETTMPSCAPDITKREREETELFTLCTRPQLPSHPAAPPGQQLSRFTSSLLTVKPVYALRTVMILTHGWTSFASARTPQGKVSEDEGRLSLVCFILSSQLLGAEPVFRAMSRKKTVKGKGSSKSPKASPSSGRDGGRTGKGLAAAAAPSSGLVYPSRPSLSNSGEFYDIAFKVSWGFKFNTWS